jgi:ring-1,2-phenylacetyl-CoA epoxidase subunit PaaE
MAIQFYKLKVKNIVRETKEAVSVVFEIPYVLRDTFKYKHGQYLTLRFFFDGIDERRAYSISSCPELDTDLQVTVKEVESGKVSGYVNNDLKIGDIVDVMPPLGHFTIDLNNNNSKNYVLIAGGSGITPIYSIIKAILHNEKNSKCLLIYTNRNAESSIFNLQLRELEQNSNFKLINIYSRPSDNSVIASRISVEKLNSIFKENSNFIYPTNEYFICGPQGMIEESLLVLNEIGVNKDHIHKESFTANIKVEEEKIEVSTDNLDSSIENISVILYGEETTIPINNGDTILIAGMKARLDPPFSCQIGACSTCRAKLIKGKVRMDDYDALTDSEIAQGYILTCTAHPITNDVLVDYDL